MSPSAPDGNTPEPGREQSAMSGVEAPPAPGQNSTDTKAPGSRLRTTLRRWCIILLVLLALVEIAGYGGAWHRYLDGLSHFQVQYLLGAVGLMLAFAALGSRRSAAMALLLAVWIGARVVPWYVGRTTGDQPADLRIMLVNVLQTNDRYADVVRHVERVDPDVVVLQEVDQVWIDHVGRLRESWPFGIHVPGGVLRGLAIYSRFPLEDVEAREFGDETTLSVTGLLRVDDVPIHFVAAHPWPPAGSYGYESRNRQLSNIADHLGRQPFPRLLIGDLNVSMWSAHYHQLVRRTRLVDSRRGFGVLPSFPMDSYALLRVPIDHCLVSDDITVVDCRLGEANGSDHAPLIVDLVLPRP